MNMNRYFGICVHFMIFKYNLEDSGFKLEQLQYANVFSLFLTLRFYSNLQSGAKSIGEQGSN